MKIGYIPSLDGIRALAVILVLISHAGLGHLVPGGFGVTVFFFLSGFLITTLLIAEFEKTHKIHYPQFFLRRFFRLFPPLILSLIFAYVLVQSSLLGGGISFSGAVSQIFYLANYHAVFGWPGATPDGTGILWSLAVEEHFYLFFPVLFSLLLTHSKRVGVSFILIAICLMVLGWRFYLIALEGVSSTRIYYATDTRIDSILFGCIMALSWNPLNASNVTKTRVIDFVLLATGVIAIFFTLWYRDETFRQTFRYSIQGIALMPLFYCAIKYAHMPIFSWLNWPWMKKLGIYSYCIYLFHFVIIQALTYTAGIESPLILVPVALISAVVIAFFVDKYVDSYFRRLRAKLR